MRRNDRAAIALVILAALLFGCGPSTESGMPAPSPIGSACARATSTPLPTVLPVPTPSTPSTQQAPDSIPGIAPTETTAGISDAARTYLDQALDIIQEHALNREHIDWDRLRGRIHGRASHAISPEEVYAAIQSALRGLGESHSYFLTPEQVAELESGAMNAANPDPSGRLLANGLAYLSMPAYASAVGVGQEYAVTMQQLIGELDASQPCGWIVDLRENTGGSLWPMLAGIGPVLGEGVVGASVYPDGRETPWYYISGQALEGDEVQIEVPEELVYRLHEPLPPVAILTGDRTMSSGEAVAVAFRGRPNSRTFGRPTVGLSTGVQRFVLSDGAWIQLAVCRMADRTGQVYGGMIPVDEYVRQEEGEIDAALGAAADWLLRQPNCASPDE